MPSELGSGRPVGLSELQMEDVAVILGSLGGFLLVVAALVAYCYCHTNTRRKQQREKDVEKVNSGSTGMGVGIGVGIGVGSSSIMVKSGSMTAEATTGGGSHESLDSVVKETPTESLQDGRPLSPVQSWGATTLLQEHERRLSVHSGAPEDSQLPTYQVDAPLHAPFPDVTVTDYRPVPTRGTSEGHVFVPCPHDDNNPCPCAGPGPDYTTYASAWDEPLTGHLLSRVRTQAPHPIQPIPQQHQQQQIHPQQPDRKRRNVTQV